MVSAEQLARTTLLFQTDLGIDPEVIIDALTETRILLVADNEIIKTFIGQIAISTAAMLMARSGHKVFIDTPDAALIGYQPPMNGDTFHHAISNLKNQLIDGIEITIGQPFEAANIAFVFGSGTTKKLRANRIISVSWTDWSAKLIEGKQQFSSNRGEWPIGALGAAVLAAAEAIKVPGRMLSSLSAHGAYFNDVFAPSVATRLILAPDDTPQITQVGDFDIISAGAVSNAYLYCLMRIPRIVGKGRVFDKDVSAASNCNRNMLLVPQFIGLPKVDVFQYFAPSVIIKSIARHFSESDLSFLAERVVVGVDDIPTRWTLSRAQTKWLGVGATSHFDSMTSVHFPRSACAGCLHPKDEPQMGPIPTIAFVSFLSGLMMTADFLRDLTNAGSSGVSRQQYLTALQFKPWAGQVHPRMDCPAGCTASKAMAA